MTLISKQEGGQTMSARHKLNKFLAGMSDSNLSLNNRDSCQFRCKNGMKCIVELIPNSSIALAYIPMKRLPDSLATRVATLERALKLNLRLQKELGASMVFDERVDQITLCSQLDIDRCSFDEFDTWLGKLIKRSAPLREDVDRFEAGWSVKKNQSNGKSPLNRAIQNAVLLKV